MREYDDQIKPTAEVAQINNTKPNYTLKFHKDGQDVGVMYFNGSVMEFTGDADESAKMFVESIQKIFAGRLKEEYEKGRADALKDHGILGAQK
jgi:hypothetical protein